MVGQAMNFVQLVALHSNHYLTLPLTLTQSNDRSFESEFESESIRVLLLVGAWRLMRGGLTDQIVRRGPVH